MSFQTHKTIKPIQLKCSQVQKHFNILPEKDIGKTVHVTLGVKP